MYKKPLFQSLWDLAMAPLRLTVLPDEMCAKLGVTSINDERVLFARDFCHGALLDIGCGRNSLVNGYAGPGVGVDVFDWGTGAIILKNTSSLPFKDHSFDTVAFLASLNHIPYRHEALLEAVRVLKPGGRMVITMINPFLSTIGHKVLWWYGEDWDRGMETGEVYGFWTSEMVKMLQDVSMKLTEHRRFIYGLNNLYVFERSA